MAYKTIDESVESGQPIELYKFANSEDTFYYTSAAQQTIYDSITYEPVAISRNQPHIQSQQNDVGITIKLPITSPLALRYVETVPASVDRVTITRIHSTDGGTPEALVLFSGQISGVAFTKNEANLEVQASSNILGRTIPKQSCRNLCNHLLYDGRCGVSDTSFEVNCVVTTISADGLVVTIDGGTDTVSETGLALGAQLAADPFFFNGGFVRRGGIEHRQVLEGASTGGNEMNVSVIMPFATLSLGDGISLFAGCDHQLPTCTNKFSNHIRYGGFPFVPRKNPFEVGVDK